MELVGKFIQYNKTDICEVIAQDGIYILCKFSYGQFVINSSLIKAEKWL